MVSDSARPPVVLLAWCPGAGSEGTSEREKSRANCHGTAITLSGFKPAAQPSLARSLWPWASGYTTGARAMIMVPPPLIARVS